MTDVFTEYGWKFLAHWWTLVSVGAFFGVDKVASVHWPWLKHQLDRIPQQSRRLVEVVALIVAVFYSGFTAWRDDHTLLTQAQDKIVGVTGELAVANADAKQSKIDAQQWKDKIDGVGGFRDQVNELKGQLGLANSELKIAQDLRSPHGLRPAPNAELRDPDTIYQHGIAVGNVDGPHVMRNQSTVTFDELFNTSDLDSKTDFEYRDMVLHITQIHSVVGQRTIASNNGASERKAILAGVVCQIVK